MKNKQFSHWLVASDIDGTLHSKLRTLPEVNKKTIAKFMSLGGNFTLASGRPVASLERAYRSVNPNCPAVILNGSGIYDYGTKSLVWKQTVSAEGREFVKYICRKYSKGLNRIEVGIFGLEKAYIVSKGLFSLGQVFFDNVPYIITDINSVPDDDWFKVIFWGNPLIIKKIKAEAEKAADKGNFMSSSPVSFEMLDKGVHKGTAVMKLAEILGVEKEHTAAIGDYYNDWDMLKTVGYPACAGQAPKPIHDICKYVACHCNKGCVADLLNMIMSGKADA